MTYVQLLLAEHGFGSETYDFDYACVLVDENGRIEQVVPGGRLAHWVLRIAYTALPLRYYGHSYQAQDQMFSDINAKQVSRAPAQSEL